MRAAPQNQTLNSQISKVLRRITLQGVTRQNILWIRTRFLEIAIIPEFFGIPLTAWNFQLLETLLRGAPCSLLVASTAAELPPQSAISHPRRRVAPNGYGLAGWGGELSQSSSKRASGRPGDPGWVPHANAHKPEPKWP